MEESWESWISDLETAGDCNFTFGAHEIGGSTVLQGENFESCLLSDTFNTENGIITSHNINPSNSISLNTQHLYAQVDSVFIPEDEASFSSKGYLQSQRTIQERDRPEGRNPRVQDHLIAERIRRGKITQHFIALSALIPGLKRVDKASVLEEAIKYMKQLKEQVKMLEEQTKKKSAESVVFVRKSQLIFTDEHVSDTSFSNSMDENLLEPQKWKGAVADQADVEAKVSDKNVLVRIQCEKQEGLMVKIIREIEKLHLSLVNSSVMPFGRSILDITVIAQMEDEFNLSVKDLVRNLRVALLQ